MFISIINSGFLFLGFELCMRTDRYFSMIFQNFQKIVFVPLIFVYYEFFNSFYTLIQEMFVSELFYQKFEWKKTNLTFFSFFENLIISFKYEETEIPNMVGAFNLNFHHDS